MQHHHFGFFFLGQTVLLQQNMITKNCVRNQVWLYKQCYIPIMSRTNKVFMCTVSKLNGIVGGLQCVCVCVCVGAGGGGQMLTPLWQVGAPSPPPTWPSAACPLPFTAGTQSIKKIFRGRHAHKSVHQAYNEYGKVDVQPVQMPAFRVIKSETGISYVHFPPPPLKLEVSPCWAT